MKGITRFNLEAGSFFSKITLVRQSYLGWNTLKSEVIRWNQVMPILQPFFESVISAI